LLIDIRGTIMTKEKIEELKYQIEIIEDELSQIADYLKEDEDKDEIDNQEQTEKIIKRLDELDSQRKELGDQLNELLDPTASDRDWKEV